MKNHEESTGQSMGPNADEIGRAALDLSLAAMLYGATEPGVWKDYLATYQVVLDPETPGYILDELGAFRAPGMPSSRLLFVRARLGISEGRMWVRDDGKTALAMIPEKYVVLIIRDDMAKEPSQEP